MDAKRGDWVQIHKVVLQPGERSPDVPPDTAGVPLEMRVKGFLLHDANIGDTVRIRTVIGRVWEGKLLKVNPRYEHDFGEVVPELLAIGQELRSMLGWGVNGQQELS